MSNSPIRVFLVDDHPIITDGLAKLINAEIGLAVCGTALDVATAQAGIEQVRPDVTVLDIGLGGENGLSILPGLIESVPEMKVLILSMYDEEVYAERALSAGALGFVMKEEAAEMILKAIRQVASGRVFLSEAMTDRVLHRATGHAELSNAPSPKHLSDRELETLRLVGLGRSSREIAEQLHLSIKTVDNYKDRIKRKLNLQNANELTRFAYYFVSK